MQADQNGMGGKPRGWISAFSAHRPQLIPHLSIDRLQPPTRILAMSDVTSDAASIDGMEGQSQYGLPAAPRSLPEAKKQLLDAIDTNQMEQALQILETWMKFYDVSHPTP
jgi:hypothetical protein